MTKFKIPFTVLLLLCFLAGVSLGDIVHVPWGETILASDTGMSAQVNFDQDGSPEFTFINQNGLITFFDPTTHNFVTQGAQEWDVIKSLTTLDTIDSLSGFHAQGDAYINPMWNPAVFMPHTESYMGVTFTIAGKRYYGWIKFILQSAGFDTFGMESYDFTISEYAYEDTPDKGIICGATETITPITKSNRVVQQSGIVISNISAQKISLKVPTSGKYTIKMYSLSGQLLETQQFSLTTGAHSLELQNSSNQAVVIEVKGVGTRTVSTQILR